MTDDLDALIDGASRGPRILTLDLERVPGQTKPRDIWHPSDVKRWNYWPPEEWLSLPRTVCLTVKLAGSKPRFIAEWDNPDDPQHVAREAFHAVDGADVIVSYNGKRADMRWLQQEWDAFGMGRPRPFKHVDLFAMQSLWAWERRSLAYLLDRLSLANKNGHYNADEARAACAGDEKAQRRLKRYNVTDVRVTEALFNRLRHHVRGVNLGLYYADAEDTTRCPYCGEADTLERSGWYTANVYRYALFTCTECGGHSRNGSIKARVGVRGVV